MEISNDTDPSSSSSSGSKVGRSGSMDEHNKNNNNSADNTAGDAQLEAEADPLHVCNLTRYYILQAPFRPFVCVWCAVVTYLLMFASGM
jgi:hypothetical protein